MNTPDPPRWKQALNSLFHPTRTKERRDAELTVTMQAVCHELIADLPLQARLDIGERIDAATRRNDVWSLRAGLFDAISRQHGEQVARERLTSLDSRWP